MVIVTQNQYLLASKIHHIVLDEIVNYVDVRAKNGRLISVRECHYTIQIIYTPESVSNPNQGGTLRSQDEQRDCSVTIRTAVNAHAVFKDLIQQIREQMPDQLYLDTALERMIAGIDLTSLSEQDIYDKDNKMVLTTMEKKKHVNRKPKKVHKLGKAKGRGKALLRRTK